MTGVQTCALPICIGTPLILQVYNSVISVGSMGPGDAVKERDASPTGLTQIDAQLEHCSIGARYTYNLEPISLIPTVD